MRPEKLAELRDLMEQYGQALRKAMKETRETGDGHGETPRFLKIGKLLLQLAPPVMLAQLIQALYNIVDSLFVGRYSASGLTALSIIYLTALQTRL